MIPAHDLDILQQRFCASLYPHTGLAPITAKARAAAASQAADGSWPDIDYTDQTLGPWLTAEHLAATRILALATHTPQAAAAFIQPALRAFRHWLEHDYHNPNWWHEQIGTPQAVGDIAILLKAQLTADDRRQVLTILARANYKGMTGENLVWTACNWIRYGLIADDPTPIADAVARLTAEIRTAGRDREGIQVDRSFHQHGKVLYSGGYGAGFAADGAWFCQLAAGTSFAIPPETVEILSSYILDGLRWSVRGRRYDFGIIGRELSRPDHSARQFVKACQCLAGTSCPRQSEFQEVLTALAADQPPVLGVRAFWRSDYLVCQRPSWYASIRMHSTRLDNTDWPCCDGEGRRNHHIADGATCLMRTGDEYADIYPLWNWRQIPGTTVEQTPAELLRDTVRATGITDFVGVLSDGDVGIAAMDLARHDTTLRARKAWFALADELLCLGAGITAAGESPIVTCIDQCRAVDTAEVCLPDGTHQPLRTSAVVPAGGGIRHNQLSYHIDVGTASVQVADRENDWLEIGVSRAGQVRGRVLTIILDHGIAPQGDVYSYRVRPAAAGSPQAAAAVVSNTGACQAVVSDSRGFAVCHEAGRVDFADGWWCAVDRPCLLLLAWGLDPVTVVVSEPEQRGGRLILRAGHGLQIVLDRDVELPSGDQAGAPVTVS